MRFIVASAYLFREIIQMNVIYQSIRKGRAPEEEEKIMQNHRKWLRQQNADKAHTTSHHCFLLLRDIFFLRREKRNIFFDNNLRASPTKDFSLSFNT